MWKCVLIWWCARLCLQKSSLSETGLVNNSPQTWKVHCVVVLHCSRPSPHYSEMIMPFSFSTWGHPKKSLSEFICLQLKSEAGKNMLCTGIYIFCFSVRVHLFSSFPLVSISLNVSLTGWMCMCELCVNWRKWPFFYNSVCCALPVWALLQPWSVLFVPKYSWLFFSCYCIIFSFHSLHGASGFFIIIFFLSQSDCEVRALLWKIKSIFSC